MKTIKTKAVIFDMDGVITNTMPDHYRCWHAVFARHGIHATHLQVYLREGQKGIESVYEIFAEHGKKITSQEANQILDEKEVYFKKIVQQRFIIGARTFLKDLHRRGFILALVTGTSRHELHKILPNSIYDLFKVIVTGSDVRQGKPHPEPYLLCIKKLAIHNKEAVVIENAPFGIESAKRAGLKCLAIQTSLPKKYLKNADAVFQSLKELKQKAKFIKIDS
ncbi:MAG: HAD family phosphatase [Candidatus Omnitrophica bacterium]|nr:HAD family phosphatase [Candidatus Omnitrophota bacterium]